MQCGYCYFQFQASAYCGRHLRLHHRDEAVAAPLYSTALDLHELSAAGTPTVVRCTNRRKNKVKTRPSVVATLPQELTVCWSSEILIFNTDIREMKKRIFLTTRSLYRVLRQLKQDLRVRLHFSSNQQYVNPTRYWFLILIYGKWIGGFC